MASHGRGRGVRRNFEAGKETKVRIGKMKGGGLVKRIDNRRTCCAGWSERKGG